MSACQCRSSTFICCSWTIFRIADCVSASYSEIFFVESTCPVHKRVVRLSLIAVSLIDEPWSYRSRHGRRRRSSTRSPGTSPSSPAHAPSKALCACYVSSKICSPLTTSSCPSLRVHMLSEVCTGSSRAPSTSTFPAQSDRYMVKCYSAREKYAEFT